MFKLVLEKAEEQEIKLPTSTGSPNKHQGCMLSPCLFNLYAEDIMRNAGLEEAQAGIKIARRWEGGSCLGTHVRIKDFKIKK